MLRDFKLGIGKITTNCLFMNEVYLKNSDSPLISRYTVRRNLDKLYQTFKKLWRKSTYFLSPLMIAYVWRYDFSKWRK